MHFVLASGNRNKLREFRAILAPDPVTAMPGGVALPPEGITSFRENAVQKARALAAALAADPSARAQAMAESADHGLRRRPMRTSSSAWRTTPGWRWRRSGGLPASSALATPARGPATRPTTPSF